MTSRNFWKKSRGYWLAAWALLLAGCSWSSNKPAEVSVETRERQIICQEAPEADPIRARKVEPIPVIDKAGIAWVGLTPKSYENIALNLQDTITHIEQQHAVIKYYEQCINAENKRRSKADASQDDI